MTHEEIQARNIVLEKQIRNLESRITKCPPGKLLCAKDRKYYKWYISSEGGIKYLSRDNEEMARQLAVKRYYCEQLKSVKQEFSLNEYYLKHHDEKTEIAHELLYSAPGYHELLEGQVHPMSAKISEWAAEVYPKSLKHSENLIHKTRAGHMVRSKSEVIIANALFSNGVPYRYEDELHLGNAVLNPDFTIMDPHNGEIIYWEHFGLIDNKDYSHNAFDKLKIYADNGIIPSINLIVTFETAGKPLDSTYVHDIIQKRLLN